MQRTPLGASLVMALFLSVFTGACAHRTSSAPLGGRSNIMLIIADDLGKDKIGVYGEGDDLTRPQTPNIDKLARRGVRFVNAYANPVCSSTRATLLTGRYSFRTGVGTVIHPRDPRFVPLYLEQLPIPMMLDLARAGYDHSQVGKWHLASRAGGGPRSPLEHGFNWTAGSPANVGTACKDCDYYSWFKQVNGSLVRVRTYATVDTTDDAIARANEMSEPWFMWLAYNAPHRPFHYPPRRLHSRADAEANDVNMYGAMVEALDAELGRLFTSIDPVRLENTVIIFLGDNGTPLSAIPPPYNQSLSKGTVYEAGINIPLIVAGPVVPRSSRGRRSSALVNTTDVYRTVADIAGVDLAQVLPPAHKVDSVSLLPELAAPNRNKNTRRYAYAEKFRPNGPGPYEGYHRSIRDERWKLVRIFRANRTPATQEEFHDLENAPPGVDGIDLCPCPEKLVGEARTAYEKLVRALEELQGT